MIPSATWGLITVLAIKLYGLFINILPTRRLWNIKDPKNLNIITALSANTRTGNYYRQATGIGQLKTIGVIIPSLKKAYKDVNLKNIHISGEHITQALEGDIITLGGPKNNEVTMYVLNLLSDNIPLSQINNTITWFDDGSKIEYLPESNNKVVTKDYGYVINTPNPLSKNNSSLTIFSGSHTYGTIAAARHFTENYKRSFKRDKYDTYIAIVSCDIINHYPQNICVLAEKHICIRG